MSINSKRGVTLAAVILIAAAIGAVRQDEQIDRRRGPRAAARRRQP
jgi:hypothetical protein